MMKIYMDTCVAKDVAIEWIEGTCADDIRPIKAQPAALRIEGP